MFNQMLITLYTRDLNKLKDELNAYADEATIWATAEGISNPTGNLCLHLVGNLNHFIGATLGNTGYVRERDKEFSLTNIERSELIAAIDSTIAVVSNTLNKLTEQDFDRDFPLEVIKGDKSTRFMLMHLLAHLDYHLGQVNYHRRLIGR